jgi:hypothetical protein|tara:strand:+ start:43 stop:420 length:378 start_codon:yes stop_codon:yes gene_type:complete
MGWEDILKNRIPEAENILRQIFEGIEKFEEQTFSVGEVMTGEELETTNFVYARAIDTMFGRVEYSVQNDGTVRRGYFEDNERAITAVNASQENARLKQAQKEEYKREPDPFDNPRFETPDDYYFN